MGGGGRERWREERERERERETKIERRKLKDIQSLCAGGIVVSIAPFQL